MHMSPSCMSRGGLKNRHDNKTNKLNEMQAIDSSESSMRLILFNTEILGILSHLLAHFPVFIEKAHTRSKKTLGHILTHS